MQAYGFEILNTKNLYKSNIFLVVYAQHIFNRPRRSQELVL